MDEVGRGCLAGPVVSAAVVLKKSINLNLLKDSKKISFNKREEISEHIKKNSYYALGIASVEEILNLKDKKLLFIVEKIIIPSLFKQLNW